MFALSRMFVNFINFSGMIFRVQNVPISPNYILLPRNFNFEIQLNAFDKIVYVIRFEYVWLKNVWYCFILIDWVHFSHKTEKISFESYWITLMFFDQMVWNIAWYGLSFVWAYFGNKFFFIFQLWKLLSTFAMTIEIVLN